MVAVHLAFMKDDHSEKKSAAEAVGIRPVP